MRGGADIDACVRLGDSGIHVTNIIGLVVHYGRSLGVSSLRLCLGAAFRVQLGSKTANSSIFRGVPML